MDYFNVSNIVSKQRNFNFINGARSIGKTYSTFKWIIKKCIEEQQEFVMLVRTQQEKKNKALFKALDKVLSSEFKDLKFKIDSELIRVEIEKDVFIVLGHCLALTESVKIKQQSYPRVKFLVFDEYMLENKQRGGYIDGWGEPDRFLSIYHTIDRDEDRVVAFLLGNNTTFYNPYHLHKAFNIPFVEEGSTYKGNNVLFNWAVPTNYVKSVKNKSKFSKMIDGSSYGDFATNGNYVEDSYNFVEKKTGILSVLINIGLNQEKYGVWTNGQKWYISSDYNSNCPTFALDDMTHNTDTTKVNRMNMYMLSQAYSNGLLFFETIEIKQKLFPTLVKFL